MFQKKENNRAGKASALRQENEKIVRILKQIFQTATQISSFDLQLSFFGDQVKGASGNISSMSSHSAVAAEEISASSTEVVSANESLSHTLYQIAQEASTLNQNTMASNSLLKSVGEKNSEMMAFSEQMQSNMQTLAEVVQKISQVVAGINQISSQTTLLSFNASIEAARAGEVGKGFGVVAGEIKTLSDTTQELTSNIDSLLHEIRQALETTQSSVDHTADSISQVRGDVESVTAMMEKNAGSIEQITSSISGAVSASEQVNTALQETSTALETVNVDLQDLANSAEELNSVSRSINQISDSVKGIEQGITELAASSGELVSNGSYPLSNDDFIVTIQDAIRAHTKWVETVSEMAFAMKITPIQTDEHKCGFGHFYFAVRPSAPRLSKLWDDIDTYHHTLHQKGEEIIQYINENSRERAVYAAKGARDLSKNIISIFERIIQEVQDMNRTGEAVF